MKVWNDEVNSCWECKMFVHSTDVCNYTKIHLPAKITKQSYKLDFDCRTEIHPDCPFNQKITKKVFEELGFNVDETKNLITTLFNKQDISIQYHKIFKQINIMKSSRNNKGMVVISQINCNNPEELKFILNRLGI